MLAPSKQTPRYFANLLPPGRLSTVPEIVWGCNASQTPSTCMSDITVVGNDSALDFVEQLARRHVASPWH